MQTFLPYPDFAASARCLDRQRLGKQRVETLQILKALSGETSGWRNHPASKMWVGHINALVLYGKEMCEEWIRRGYKDTCLNKILFYRNIRELDRLPDWMGNDDFHASHRSNLLRKNSEFYSKYNWFDPPDLPYVWPK